MNKISVLIPCYNHGRYLAEAIQSALDQDYPDLEVIVLDDGSTDETAQVAAAFGSRIAFHRQLNRGESVTKNRLMAMASGEYIYLLDADDVLLPGALRRLAHYLDTHPDDGAVYSDCYYCDAQLNITGRMSDGRESDPSGDILPYLLLHARICGTLFRAAAIRRHGLSFDQSILVSADWEFIIQFAAYERFGHVDAVSYLYRFHGDNVTLRVWQKRQESLMRNRRKVMESWFFDGLPDETRTQFLTDYLVFHLRGREAEQAELLAGPQVAALSPAGKARLYQSYGLSALEAGDTPTAREWLMQSLEARGRASTRTLYAASYLPSAVVRPLLGAARRATGREHSHPMDGLINDK